MVERDAYGNLLMDGAEAVRTRHAKSMSDNPHLHYDIPNHIALGEWVIDEELVTGFTKPGSSDVARAVLIDRFSGELIREIVTSPDRRLAVDAQGDRGGPRRRPRRQA